MKRNRLFHLVQMFECHMMVARRYRDQWPVLLSSTLEARSCRCMALSFRYAMHAFMADLIERDSWKEVAS